MKKIKIDLENIKKQNLDLIVDYLKEGKVVAMPTDTIYGFHCDATSKDATIKIRKMKKRDKAKSFLILVSSLEMLKKYCYVSVEQDKLLQEFGGKEEALTSVILKSKGKLPKELTAGLDSVAVRLPKSDFLTTIIERVGAPIVSTSLNISGQKPLKNLESISEYFKKAKPDLAVDAGEARGRPSRIVDLKDVEDVKVLRK